jgi:hypothetical protein
MNSSTSVTLCCVWCGKPVSIKDAKADGNGKPVHSECEVQKLARPAGNDTATAPLDTAVEDYSDESWVTLYQTALIELEHAKLSGRILEARTEILARVEKLLHIPGLHVEEQRAIADALAALRILEIEEATENREQQKQAVEKAAKSLQAIQSSIQARLTGDG